MCFARSVRKNSWIGIVGLLVAFGLGGVLSAIAADQQSFSPVRRLTTPDTDEVSIDVEVVGTSSINPCAHCLTPRRSLQLRLERAYVDTLLWRDTQGSSFSALSLSLDSGSKQPRSISWARMYKSKGSPQDVTRDAVVDLNRRTLIIQIDGIERWKNSTLTRQHCLNVAAQRNSRICLLSNPMDRLIAK